MSGPVDFGAADLQLLEEARRQLVEERVLDAVDELRGAADWYVVAALRGESTTAALGDVVQAAHRLLRSAS